MHIISDINNTQVGESKSRARVIIAPRVSIRLNQCIRRAFTFYHLHCPAGVHTYRYLPSE